MNSENKETLISSFFLLGLFCYAVQFWGYLMDGTWNSFTINDTLEYIFNVSFSVDPYHRIFIVEKSLEFVNKIFDSYNAGHILISASFLGILIPVADN